MHEIARTIIIHRPVEEVFASVAGILDPAKVTRSALANAAGVAGMILSTGAPVTELTEGHAVGAGTGARGTYE